MQNKLLAKDSLGLFVTALQKESTVFAPAKDAKVPNKYVWRRLGDGEVPDMHFANTEMSPKNFAFPQTECMMQFAATGTQANIFQQVDAATEQMVLFNIRPCDAKAFGMMDTVFCQDARATDVYWKDKRERMTLVGLACNSPCPSCFCHEMNSGPHDAEELDVLITDLGETLLVAPITPRGATLVAALSDAGASDARRAEAVKVRAEKMMPLTLGMENIAKRTVPELFENPYWERAAQTCLHCGVCTFVCPTCHCFDIQDEVAPQGTGEAGIEGRRVRNWDTCMAPLFTQHASGHNPRSSKASRIRQRFMHKFKYIPMRREDTIGCVGCGRCVRLCPVNIDVRDAINAMNG